MQQQSRSTAQILPFGPPEGESNRLTIRDRMEVLDWVETGPGRGYRVAIHDPHPSDAPELGGMINIYRAGQNWPHRTIARDGGAYRAWRCADGVDIGVFRTLREALAAVLATLF